jgi:hypothetical protein
MIITILKELDTWFNEPESQASNRSKLLSKLALLEVCGWIEEEFDRLIISAENGRLNDSNWCKKNLIEKTYGFHYEKHLRRMFSKLFGEVTARKIEEKMEQLYPGELVRMDLLLSTLWKKRCNFAHADFTANIATQQTFDAPSWSIAQQITINLLINKFEASLIAVLPLPNP